MIRQRKRMCLLLLDARHLKLHCYWGVVEGGGER